MPNKKEIVDVINLKLDETFISDVNNYKYTAQDNLVAWFDLASTLIDQSASSGQIASLNYRLATSNNNGAAVISKEAFNTTSLTYPQYSNARFNQHHVPNAGIGTGRHAKIVYNSSGPIVFGSGGGDKPFSVSIWAKVNPDILSTTHPGRLFEFGASSSNYAYRANIDKDGDVEFSLKIFGGAGTKFFTTTLSNFRTDYAGWNHYVFTYNGDESSTDVKIYVNGTSTSVTATSAGSYTGMGAGGTELYIGAAYNEQNQWNGFISQVAIFNSEISQENVRAIYEGTSIGSYQDKTTYFSGDLSNPAKDIIKTLDTRIRNIHDCGVKKSSQKRVFDDLNTINFIEREAIGSIGVEEGKTSTPYVALNSYNDYGIKVTSAFDNTYTTNQIRNDFMGDSEPFKENEKIFLDKDFAKRNDITLDIFEQSGLSRDMNHKDIIEINLKPSESTKFGIEQGVGSSQTNDLMVYWNNKEKKWEKTGGTVLKPASVASVLESGKIGFAPTAGFVIPENKDNFDAAFKNYGMHVDNFGFPKHPKYQAGEDQYINMQDYICEPFVLEGIAYECDAVLHVDKAVSSGLIESKTSTNFSQAGHIFSLYTFFILNQRDGHQYEESFGSKIYDLGAESFTNADAIINDSVKSNNSVRDLVCYSQVSVFSDSDGSDDTNYGKFKSGQDTSKLGTHSGFLIEGLSRELNISGSNFIDSSSSIVDANFAHSGTLVMSGVVNENGSHESYGITFDISGDKEAITNLGAYRSQNLKEKIFSRGFGNSVYINNKNNNVFFNHTLFPGTSTGYVLDQSIKKTHYTNARKPNPYILMPGDKLVLGWQSPVPFDAASLNNTNGSSTMSINTSTGKLRLYGSFLNNKKQQKSSDIFYENNYIGKAMGIGSIDQYQIETRSELSSSYVSYEFLGDVLNRTSTKKELSSPSVKSSIHFVNHLDENEIIFDSHLPDVRDYLLRRGVTSLSGEKVTNSSDLNIFTNHTNRAPVYVQDQKRQTSSKITFEGKTIDQSKEIMFTKGFSAGGTTDGLAGARTIAYGMHNYNISKNSAQFNTRHFGYRSDLIRQRKICAYEQKGIINYPVEVRFFNNKENIKGSESTAQNINPHAESYFPFFDGGTESVTFRIDDTSKIDTIKIGSDLLDEQVLKQAEDKEIQELNRIILR